MTDSYQDRIEEIKLAFEGSRQQSEKITLTPINGSGDILLKIEGRDPYGRFNEKNLAMWYYSIRYEFARKI